MKSPLTVPSAAMVMFEQPRSDIRSGETVFTVGVAASRHVRRSIPIALPGKPPLPVVAELFAFGLLPDVLPKTGYRSIATAGAFRCDVHRTHRGAAPLLDGVDELPVLIEVHEPAEDGFPAPFPRSPEPSVGLIT